MSSTSLSDRVSLALKSLELPPDLASSVPLSSTDAGGITTLISQSVRPLSHGDYLRRVRSFRLSNWFAQLPPLSPFALARYGWFNVARDTIACESCGVHAQPKGGETFKTALIAARALRTVHLKGCAWTHASSPRTFAQIPCARAARVIIALEAKRIKILFGEGVGMGGGGAGIAGVQARESAVKTISFWSPYFFSQNSLPSVTARTLTSAAIHALNSATDDSRSIVDEMKPLELPLSTTAALLAISGWRVIPPSESVPSSPATGVKKRSRDSTERDESMAAALPIMIHSLECHLCGQVIKVGENQIEGGDDNIVPMSQQTPHLPPSTSAIPSALILAMRSALAAAQKAVTAFTTGSGGGDTGSTPPMTMTPSSTSSSIPSPPIPCFPRHFWGCPYARTSETASFALRSAVTSAIQKGEGERVTQTLTAHVGAALGAIVHASGDVHSADATSLRLITAARNVGDAVSAAAYAIDESDEDEEDDRGAESKSATDNVDESGAIRDLPGWFFMLLQIIATTT